MEDKLDRIIKRQDNHETDDRRDFGEIKDSLNEIKTTQAVGNEHLKGVESQLKALNGKVIKNQERSLNNERAKDTLTSLYASLKEDVHTIKDDKKKFNWFWMERAVYIIIALIFLFLSLK